MKKLLLAGPLCGILLYLSLSSHSLGYAGNKTGSSGDSIGCGGYGCHSPVATAGVAVSLILDSAGTIVTRYTPGLTYRLKVTGINTVSATLPRFGFQLSAYIGTGAAATQAGNFSALPVSSAIHTYSSIDVVTHTSPFTATGGGATGSLDTFSLYWTAPAAGSGTVKIAALLNMVNGDTIAGNDDKWNIATVTYPEGNVPSKLEESKRFTCSIYPNPATNELHVSIPNNSESAIYTVLSPDGKWLLTGTLQPNAPVINVSGLSAGIYLLQVQSNQEVYSSLFQKVIND
jgi:hypothetical protein